MPISSTIMAKSLRCIDRLTRFGLGILFLREFADINVCEVDRISMMLQRDWTTFRYSGKLSVFNYCMAVKYHGEAVAFKCDMETIPFAGLSISIVFRCDSGPHFR